MPERSEMKSHLPRMTVLALILTPQLAFAQTIALRGTLVTPASIINDGFVTVDDSTITLVQPWVERDTSSVKDQEGYDEQNQRETNRAENGKPERLGEEQVSECYPTHCPECAEMLEVLLQHAPTRTVSDQRANEPKAHSSFWCASSLGALLNGTNQCDERPERDEAASVTSGGRSFLVSRRISTIGCRVPRGQVDSTAHMR